MNKTCFGKLPAAAAIGLLFTAAVCSSNAADLDRLSPIGEGKGIFPGRVVWAHDPKAAAWPGPGDGHWWEDKYTDP